MLEEKSVDRGNIAVGIGLGIGLTILGIGLTVALAALTKGVGLILLFGVGVVQVVWMGPVCAYFFKKGETRTGQGLLIIAGLVFLLNATCFGLIRGIGH
jgi:heme/copper-type cytochrome/quinol oxidase subunit 4